MVHESKISNLKHGRSHHAEQIWCHNTALFDSICHGSLLHYVPACLYEQKLNLTSFKSSENINEKGICHTIAMTLGGHPNLAMVFQSPSRLTVSKPLVRSCMMIY